VKPNTKNWFGFGTGGTSAVDNRKSLSALFRLACFAHCREALAPVFAALNQYDATTHFVGQSTILTLSDHRATGEAYCLAHHVTVNYGQRHSLVASLRYLDTFVKTDGAWLFAERRLYVDWVDERALS
jgi:hypothetical protein